MPLHRAKRVEQILAIGVNRIVNFADPFEKPEMLLESMDIDGYKLSFYQKWLR